MLSGSTRTGPSPRSKYGLKKKRSIGQQSWTKERRKASKLNKNCRANGGTNDPPNALGDPQQARRSICCLGSSPVPRQLALSAMMVLAVGEHTLDVSVRGPDARIPKFNLRHHPKSPRTLAYSKPKRVAAPKR